MNYPALLSFVCGFASLSLEILWVRMYGFAKAATPAAFGFVLAAYLVGIALGARYGVRACRATGSDAKLWQASIIAMLLSAWVSAVLPFLFGALTLHRIANPLLDLTVIALPAAVLAFVFPIAHHLGTRHFTPTGSQQRGLGRRFALVYTANVAGAGLGPLVTGYVLLDVVSLQTSFFVVGALQAAAALFLTCVLRVALPRRALAGTGLAAIAVFAAAGLSLDSHRLVQVMSAAPADVRAVVENRHGIVTVIAGPAGDDAVYGGNVYDGRTNLDPQRNTNGLERPLLMAALHPAPKRVLMPGLSIGTWLTVVREFPGVESIDVVEINPGYLQALQAYAPQASAVRDPRVNVFIDDARRWLRRHPDRQYDLIIMNTTVHWRSNSSLLLSMEMMQALRSHMAPGAVLTFNATGSPDAFFTASRVFRHTYRYGNFIYAADFDFRDRKDSPRTREVYQALRLQGRPFFAPQSPAVEGFMRSPFITMEQEARQFSRPLQEITDGNMINEFKYGRVLYGIYDLLDF